MANQLGVVSVNFVLIHDSSGQYFDDQHIYTYKAPNEPVKSYEFEKEILKESSIRTNNMYQNSAFQYFNTGVEFLGFVEA